MEEIRRWTGEAWFLAGDWNSVRTESERNKPGGEPRNLKFLNDFIGDHELIDLQLNGGAYTWSNKHDDPLLCRLDRVMVCTKFDAAYKNTIQTALVRSISDHNALLIDLTPSIIFSSYFKVENSWIMHKDFLKKIDEWWCAMSYNGTPSFIFFKKLQNLKFFLKSWAKETFGDVKKKEAELNDNIERLNLLEETSTLSSSQKEKRAQDEVKLREVKTTRARMALQRAKVKGFTDGDKNTHYFHCVANGKMKRSCISKLEVEGVDVFNQEVIKKEIHKYYEQLFTATTTISPSFENIDFFSIDNEHQAWLERTFEEDEVYNAIKMCGANKAPGPDGFNMEFYKVVGI